MSAATPQGVTYAAAGVDTEAGDKAVELMKDAVRATHGPQVLGGVGGFARRHSAERNEKCDRVKFITEDQSPSTGTPHRIPSGSAPSNRPNTRSAAVTASRSISSSGSPRSTRRRFSSARTRRTVTICPAARDGASE